jgi:hypothetical protein
LRQTVKSDRLLVGVGKEASRGVVGENDDRGIAEDLDVAALFNIKQFTYPFSKFCSSDLVILGQKLPFWESDSFND